MQVFVVGLNHRSAPVSVREKFAIADGRLGEFLQRSTALSHLEEALAISTCNRVELYGASTHPEGAQEQWIRYLAEFQGEPLSQLQPHLYGFVGEEAVRHGFRVASSLDYMIVGEPQILGQFKEAYRKASETGSTGRFLNKFFHQALHVAKKVRTETAIGVGPVSVSYAAVVLAKQIFGDLREKTALILGAGKMSEVAVRHLKNAGIQKILIGNRTEERAREIAQRTGGETIPFDNFQKWLSDADVVLTSTAAESYLIGATQVQEALRLRKHRPIFFIDIAVPRNISPEVNGLANVYLYDIDDLGTVVEANKAERMAEAQKAEQWVKREAASFMKKLKSLEAQSVANKILHDPMLTLKDEAPEDGREVSPEVVRKLFRLDEA